ncbi:MAG: alpha/beta hydrolase [Acidimicrobiia bacterium]|nr:alpha/beta hydrolase [Acidimicrobiia bacterium]
MVARGLAIRHPERVEALVLMDTSHGPIPGFDPTLMDLAAEIALTEGKDVLKQILDDAAPLDNPAYQKLVEERPGYKEFGERKWADLSERMWAGLARQIAYQADELDALGGVTCPTLVLVGELDKPFRGSSRRMAERIPGARLAIIPGAGHSPQFEVPDAWLTEIVGFLAAVPGSLRSEARTA